MAISNALNATQTGVQCLTSGGVWNGRTITAGTGISVTNGDGVSGNPTISATGASGGPGTVYVYDDFLGAPLATTGIPIGTLGVGNANLSVFGTGTGNAIAGVSGSSINPGIIQIQVGVNNSRTVIYGNITAPTFSTGDFSLGNGECSIEWYVKPVQLSNGTDRFLMSCGLGNSITDTAAPVDGCFFSYVDNVNSGNWTIQNIKSGSGTSSADSGVAADTNFHNFKVVVNAAASSVSFYIDGTEVSGSPLTTQIPTNTLSFFFKIIKTAGTTNVQAQADFMRFIYTLTTPRAS